MSLTAFAKRGGVEWLVALIAFGAQAMLLFVPSQPRTQQENLGDFKLVYASMAALAQSGQAYNVDALAQVDRDNGRVEQLPDQLHDVVEGALRRRIEDAVGIQRGKACRVNG